MARKTTRKADVRVLGGEGSGLRRRGGLLLCLLLLVVAAPSCNLFNSLGDAWGTSGMANPCAGMGGGGGSGGADVGGGDPGVGGSEVGSAGAGVGGSDVGSAGAGASPGTPRPPPPSRRHRRIRSGIGTAFEADCTPPDMSPAPGLPMMAPKLPAMATLSTARLRAIAAANGIGAGQTGIQLNRTIGLAFENWVLVTLGQRAKRWTTPIPSPARKKANNGGLPASVIPEYVSDLDLVVIGDESASSAFPLSQFWEVKAVTGVMTPSTSQYQIRGLIDVAALSSAGMSSIPHHPPPVVVFTTAGSTILGQLMLAEATQRGVAIWQQFVFEDITLPNDPNPDLYIGAMYPMNDEVYGAAMAVPRDPSGLHSKLTSPTTPPMAVPGDPDPPEVD